MKPFDCRVVMVSTSLLCSSSLVPNVLLVSLMQDILQVLQGIWYTQSVLRSLPPYLLDALAFV